MDSLKTLIIYNSISGFTEKYAYWIAEDLECDCYELADIPAGAVEKCNILIFGGSLHAVGIAGFKALQRRFPDLDSKTVYIFATGASPGREHIPGEIIEKNFSPKQKDSWNFYYFRGGFDFNKLDPINKFIMSLMRLKIRLTREERRSPDEKGMWAAFKKPVDFTDRKRIATLIEDVRGIQEKTLR